MRNVISLFVIMLFIASSIPAYGMPVGNPASPAMIKKGLVLGEDEKNGFGIALNPEVDYVFDKNMKYQDKRDDAQYAFYGANAGLVFTDKLFAYGIIGAADAEYKLDVGAKHVKWDTDTNIAWGAGATLILYEKEITVRDKAILRIGIDGKYRRSDLDLDKVTINDDSYDAGDSAITDKKFEQDDWQVSAGVSCQFDRVIPYAGVKYSDMDGEASVTVSGTEYKSDFSAEDNFGLFCGIDILFTDCFTANVEGRFIDETAITAGGTVRF